MIKMWCLPENYQIRKELEYFDDTCNTDNWQKEVYISAKKLADRLNVSNVYDFGCGSGYKLIKNFESSNIRFCGVDLEPTIRILRAKYPMIPWLTSDEFNLKELSSNSMLICSDVIEHIPSPDVFLEELAMSDVKVVVFSTPARELLTQDNQTLDLGPPLNKSHVCEWSCLEFSKFIGKYFNISEHFVSNAKQATQVIVAYPRTSTPKDYKKVFC